jgi:hypothetical protein
MRDRAEARTPIYSVRATVARSRRGGHVGSKELQALVTVLEQELAREREGHILGTWTIRYDGERGAFTFDKCENDGYCEERPSVLALDGAVLDPGGPIVIGG